MTQNVKRRLLEVETFGGERSELLFDVLHVAVHARGLSEKDFHRHVDAVGFGGVRELEVRFLGDRAEHREGAAFALAEGREDFELRGIERNHVALLTFVAPDFQGAHARLFNRDLRHVEGGALPRQVGEFGHGVREPARTDVVNGENRIFRAHFPATVDHFLRTAFHFGVAALDRVEVERFGVGARRHRARSAAAETNAHARTAEDDEQAARRRDFLLRLVVADVADAAREHDGFVVAVAGAADVRFKGAEVAENVRAAEFVVEGGAAERAVRHDGKRRRDARGRAVEGVGLFARHRVGVVFPGLRSVGEMQSRGREAAQARLRAGAAARGAFVADFAARARRGAREGRNRGRVVVRFHLEDRVGHFNFALELVAVDAVLARTRIETRGFGPFEDGRVVGVGRDGALRGHLVRAADHAEERFFAVFPVDRPAGVEDLVAAVFGVGLREHHEFDVGRIAVELREGVDEVVDFVFGKRKTHRNVRFFERGAAARHDVDRRHGTAFERFKELRRVKVDGHDRFRHAVVENGGELRGKFVRNRSGEREREDRAALDAGDALNAAVLDDVGSLRRPGRDRAQTRHHHEGEVFAHGDGRIAVGQERFEAGAFIVGQSAFGMHKMHEAARDRFDKGRNLTQRRERTGRAEVRKSQTALEFENRSDLLVHCRKILVIRPL